MLKLKSRIFWLRAADLSFMSLFKNLKLRKAGIILFIISWFVLLLLSFTSVRVFLKVQVFHMLGFHSGEMPDEYSETIALQDFQPVQELVPVDPEIPENPRFPLVEIHGHLFRTSAEELRREMKKSNTRLFVDQALRTNTLEKFRQHRADFPDPDVFIFVGLNWDHTGPDFARKMAADLEEIAKTGEIRGVKIWKDFGLYRKPNGKLLAIDDRAMKPVWDVIAKYNLIIAMHTADPPAFFRKIDGKNERFQELARNPDWSFAGDSYPSFAELLKQRENLYKRRRDIRFIGQHFAELGHNLEEADRLLRENPNVWLDTAQRIDELGRQPRAARDFFLKHQDRILYGTDGTPRMKKIQIYWRFFETDDESFAYHPPSKARKGLWKIDGLDLPDSVLKKIYYLNALKLFDIPESEFLADE